MRKGFSLIELSIVLVIIALIISGIFVGRGMFDAAENRTIIAQMNNYTTAYKEFINKYQAIPGDMNNAANIWGADANCPTTGTNSTVKELTCNGDGNGMIGNWTNGATSSSMEYEWFRAWQHLANANMIEGSYTGVSGTGSTETTIGLNVPDSKSGKGGWTLMYMVSDGTIDANFFNSAVASHVLIYGLQTAGSFTDAPTLTGLRASDIDTKIDDTLPFTGKARVKKNTSGCATSALPTAAYLLTSTGSDTCQMLFIMGM